jgi:Ca2+-binding EF-hand superfamily protein
LISSRGLCRYGLRDYGIDLTPTELEQVFLYFDRDGNGFIDCTEFLVGLRGDLPPSRKKFVRMAFDILDTDKSGEKETLHRPS